MVEGGRQIGAAGLLYGRGGGGSFGRVGQRGCWRSEGEASIGEVRRTRRLDLRDCGTAGKAGDLRSFAIVRR